MPKEGGRKSFNYEWSERGEGKRVDGWETSN